VKPIVVLGMAQTYPGYDYEQVTIVASLILNTIVAFGQKRHNMVWHPLSKTIVVYQLLFLIHFHNTVIPHYLDNRLTDGGEVVSITHRLRSAPQKRVVSVSYSFIFEGELFHGTPAYQRNKNALTFSVGSIICMQATIFREQT
jgi:hypothetical protein